MLHSKQGESPGGAHQREGIDGLEHGALAGHHAPVAQQHQKAGQAVEQRGEGGRRLLKAQEARKWPLVKTHFNYGDYFFVETK